MSETIKETIKSLEKGLEKIKITPLEMQGSPYEQVTMLVAKLGVAQGEMMKAIYSIKGLLETANKE